MSNREMAIQLINQMSDYKVKYAIAYLQGLTADEVDEIDEAEDDEFCEKLYENYKNSASKGDFVSFEEAARLCGVDINEIRN